MGERPPEPKHFVLRDGVLWRYQRTSKGLKNTEDGDCDGPHIDDRLIRIRARIRGVRLLESFIHEMLHGCLWDLDDEAIHETAEVLAKNLDLLGYRRLGE